MMTFMSSALFVVHVINADETLCTKLTRKRIVHGKRLFDLIPTLYCLSIPIFCSFRCLLFSPFEKCRTNTLNVFFTQKKKKVEQKKNRFLTVIVF